MDTSHLNQIEGKILPDHPLFAIVEEAYGVFAYPKPKSTGVCKFCCMSPEIEKDFFTPPIRELPLNYVRDWYYAAYDPEEMLKETWAYLIPRILELLAAGEEISYNGIEVSLNRYDTGNPNNWSLAEWTVLENFQRTFLAHNIRQGNDPLDDLLCMFNNAGWELQSLLDQVSSTRDEILAERFWNDWCRYCAPGLEGIWITPFWQSPENTAAYEFYTSQDLYDRMKALAFANNMDTGLSAKAFAVAAVLEAKR